MLYVPYVSGARKYNLGAPFLFKFVKKLLPILFKHNLNNHCKIINIYTFVNLILYKILIKMLVSNGYFEFC